MKYLIKLFGLCFLIPGLFILIYSFNSWSHQNKLINEGGKVIGTVIGEEASDFVDVQGRWWGEAGGRVSVTGIHCAIIDVTQNVWSCRITTVIDGRAPWQTNLAGDRTEETAFAGTMAMRDSPAE